MWSGNAAKYRIINEIIQHPNASILDFGAGSGRGWIPVLERFPDLKLCLFEPDPLVNAELKRNKEKMGRYARVVDHLPKNEKFDFIVSFSVFEHVSDPNAYLLDAKEHLKADGTFILNYDDGHFQHWVDLGNWRTWRAGLSGLAARALAPLGRMRGRTSLDLKRHSESDLFYLVQSIGFKIERKRYENIVSFKRMYKGVHEDSKIPFMEEWVRNETFLNSIENNAEWLRSSSYSITLDLKIAH